MADLPPLPLALDLVDWFFEKVNYVRYPIEEHLFRQSWLPSCSRNCGRLIWESGFDRLYRAQGIDSESVLAMPLFFIVMAIAIRVAPDEWDYTEEQKRSNSLRMYWSCTFFSHLPTRSAIDELGAAKTAIIMASAVQAENVQLVETHILVRPLTDPGSSR